MEAVDIARESTDLIDYLESVDPEILIVECPVEIFGQYEVDFPETPEGEVAYAELCCNCIEELWRKLYEKLGIA